MSQGALIDFSGPVHGEIITTQFAPDVTISAINPNRSHDIAAMFDSTMTGTSDPDLEGPPWSGGNLPSTTVMGNLLILAENDNGAGSGVLSDPDDEGQRPAGDLIFDFSSFQTEFGFDIVDVEGMMENGDIEFFASGSSIASMPFSQFSVRDPSVAFGNNTINRINPITSAELGVGAFDRVVIHLAGSGAVDNINFIPTPGAAGVFALAGLAGLRRRR